MASTSSRTHIPEINLGINQYLVTGDEPLLFHTGMQRPLPARRRGGGRR